MNARPSPETSPARTDAGLRSRRALTIANPIAGRGRARANAEELAVHLRAAGIECEVHFTSGRGDATARAARLEPGVEFVFSVGGDGTLSEVLAGLPRRDVTLGVLPMGTANVLALDLRLPRAPADVARLVERGRVQLVDTAVVNGSMLSFLVSGVGFDATVVHELEARRRGPISKVDWVAAGWRAFRAWDPPRLEIEVDGRKLPGAFGQVLVSNIVHYAGFDVLDRSRVFDDGLFEVYTFRGSSRARLVANLLRGTFGRFPGGPVEMVRARHVRVRSDRPAPLQVDGDARGTTPFELVVGSQPFRLLVP